LGLVTTTISLLARFHQKLTGIIKSKPLIIYENCFACYWQTFLDCRKKKKWKWQRRAERNLNKNEISLVFTMQIANCTHQPPTLMRNAK